MLGILLLPIISNSQNLMDEHNGHDEEWREVLQETGDILQIALPVGALATTVIKKDWQGTKQFAYSFGTSFIVMHSLKRVVRKQRPDGRNLYDSFPSGHTTSAFTGAAFIQRRYGWKYGKYAYALATIVGISRMESPRAWHDGWDVLAGAAIGIGAAYVFTKPYEHQDLKVSFNSFDDGFVVSLNYNF